MPIPSTPTMSVEARIGQEGEPDLTIQHHHDQAAQQQNTTIRTRKIRGEDSLSGSRSVAMVSDRGREAVQYGTGTAKRTCTRDLSIAAAAARPVIGELLCTRGPHLGNAFARQFVGALVGGSPACRAPSATAPDADAAPRPAVARGRHS